MPQKLENDPEFRALPDGDKKIVYLSFFDKKIADDEFRSLDPQTQNAVKENYLSRYNLSLQEPEPEPGLFRRAGDAALGGIDKVIEAITPETLSDELSDDLQDSKVERSAKIDDSISDKLFVAHEQQIPEPEKGFFGKRIQVAKNVGTQAALGIKDLVTSGLAEVEGLSENDLNSKAKEIIDTFESEKTISEEPTAAMINRPIGFKPQLAMLEVAKLSDDQKKMLANPNITKEEKQKAILNYLKENQASSVQNYKKVISKFPKEPDKEFEGGFLGFMEDVTTTLPRSAASMAATAVNVPLGANLIYRQTLGSAYQKHIDKGIAPDVAKDAANLESIISTPLETFGNIFGLKLIKGAAGAMIAKTGLGKKATALISRILLSSAGGGAEEYLQAHSEALGDIYAEDPEASADEMFEKFKEKVSTSEFQKGAGRQFAVGAVAEGLFPLAGAAFSQQQAQKAGLPVPQETVKETIEEPKEAAPVQAEPIQEAQPEVTEAPPVTEQIVEQEETPAEAPQKAQEINLKLEKNRADIKAINKKKVSDMTENEKDIALHRSQITGLKNRRAYNEGANERKKHQFFVDANSLKWFNDNISHEAGNKLLESIGDSILTTEIADSAYHSSGDEFIVEGDDLQFVNNELKKANDWLLTNPLQFEMEDGSKVSIPARFEYGTGKTLEEADKDLIRAKTEAETLGIRSARGKTPAGFTVRDEAKGDLDQRGEVQAEITKPTGQKEDVRTGVREKEKVTSALRLMLEESEGSQTKSSFVDESGKRQFVKASTPNWMKEINEVAKLNKDRFFSRSEIKTLLNKEISGQLLTQKQQNRFLYLSEAATKISKTDPDIVSQQDADLLEKEGFKIIGKKETAGDLNAGDKFFGTVDGEKDTYTVKKIDKDGTVHLINGVKKELDIFDQVDIVGIKKAKKATPQTAFAAIGKAPQKAEGRPSELKKPQLKPLITTSQKKNIQKKKEIKKKQLDITSAKEAREGIQTMIRDRRHSLNLASYETNLFINEIEQSTTKAQREALPFIIEKTGVPKELKRPDIEKAYDKNKEHLNEIASQVRTHFNKSWQKMKEHIPDMSAQEIENYVTHIWDIPRSKQQEVTNWFTTRNRFLKKRYIETLEKGITELGLKPKVLDISEIIRVHDAVTNKAIENAKFVEDLKGLKKDGVSLMERSDKAPQDWVMIDHPALRKGLVIPGDIKTGEKISPQLQDILTEMGVAIGRRISPKAFGKATTKLGEYRRGEQPEVRFQRFMENKTIAHEIGHHIDTVLNLGDQFLQKHKTELYELNKKRIKDFPGKERYTESTEEQIAEAFAYLFTNPEQMQKVAPTLMADLLNRLKEDGTLSKLVDFDFERNAKNLIEEQLNTLVQLPVKVHPDLAKPLKVVFESRFDHPAIKAFENISGVLKKTSLSISLFHHMALGETGVATIGLPRIANIYLNPVKIYNALVRNQFDVYKNEPLARDAISHGVQLGATSDIPVQKIQKFLNDFASKTKNIVVVNRATKLLSTFNAKWDSALWDYLHDTLKLYAFESLSSKIDPKLDQKKAKQEVAQLVNDTFGGQNWDTLMVSPKTQQVMSWMLLSPDWTISTLRQALAPTGIGSIYKETAGVRRRAGVMFWLKAGLYFGVGINLLNMAFRRDDEEENPEFYKSKKKGKLEQTMIGNALGHQSHLFAGRYEDGRERYIRWGKQFRELPEMFFEDVGFSPISASLKKIGGKMNPLLQITSQIATGHTLSGFKNDDVYGKKGWDKTFGIFKTLLKSPLPFSSRTLLSERAEFHISDIALPSSKGMSRYKSVELFKTAIIKQDEQLLQEVYQDTLENNLPAYTLFTAALTSLKAEESRDFNRDLKVIEDIQKRLPLSDIKEAERVQRKMKRMAREEVDKKAGIKLLETAIEESKQYQEE